MISIPIPIVHRDAELLVVNKPSGLPTTSPDGGDCLVARVRDFLAGSAGSAADFDPDAPRLHPTSRLDAEVSGLVTFARTARATEALLEARRAHAYGRTYLALVTNAPTDDEGRWELPIAVDPRDRRRRLVSFDDPETKPSSTRFSVRARGELSLLALFPETGRTHQLRVHCAHVGSPMFGDVIYGGERRVTRANGRVVSAKRVMLHCAALNLPNVAGEGRLALVAPVPVDFANAWRSVGGDPSVLG